MPSRIVKQPDGKLAIFDGVSDRFVVVDMTEEECLVETMKYFDMTEGKAKEKMLGGLEDWLPWHHGVSSETQDTRFRHAVFANCLNADGKDIQELKELFTFNIDRYLYYDKCNVCGCDVQLDPLKTDKVSSYDFCQCDEKVCQKCVRTKEDSEDMFCKVCLEEGGVNEVSKG